MNSPVLQLLVLAAIAVFLILRLKSVLGTRDGYEAPPMAAPRTGEPEPQFDAIEGGPDMDIIDHAGEDTPAAQALARMKEIEPDFTVTEFLGGARAAYEMILMGFEHGNLEELRPLLTQEVYSNFEFVIDQREEQGLSIEADFIGLRELSFQNAYYDEATGEADVTVKFISELSLVVRNAEGEIVEGSETEVKRRKDVWTFTRTMGSEDLNWTLAATDE